jgi:hypothetical protein
MPFIAMNFGGFLLVLGILAFASPSLFGAGDAYAKTSLIPAAVGLLLEMCGAVSLSKPGLRKHLMHVAALIALIGFIGGFMPIGRAGFDWGKASVVVGLIMSALCLVFLLICIRSFIAARRARQAAAAAQ